MDYLTRTADGRLLFGSRGAPYRFGSAITDDQDRHADTHARIARAICEWFPALDGVAMTHAWGGPVGMPRDWMPTVTFDASSRIATARGYTGLGVSTTNLAGRVLADLINGASTATTALPLVRPRSRDWEPEPVRWLAIRAMQRAFARSTAPTTPAEGGQSAPGWRSGSDATDLACPRERHCGGRPFTA